MPLSNVTLVCSVAGESLFPAECITCAKSFRLRRSRLGYSRHHESAFVACTSDPNSLLHLRLNSCPAAAGPHAVSRTLHEHGVHSAGGRLPPRPCLIALSTRQPSCCFSPGTPGHRFLAPHSKLMIHQPKLTAAGKHLIFKTQNPIHKSSHP